jgi:hypothetical protein
MQTSALTLLQRLGTDSQALRKVIQGAFVVLCLWIGVEFHLFMRWAESLGAEAYAPHPPGAEGFLPISALMSLKLWAATGQVHPVHPAGLFVAITGLGMLLGHWRTSVTPAEYLRHVPEMRSYQHH